MPTNVCALDPKLYVCIPFIYACRRRYGVSSITFANIPCPLSRQIVSGDGYLSFYEATCNAFLPSTAPGILVFSDSRPYISRSTTGGRIQGANVDGWVDNVAQNRINNLYHGSGAQLAYKDKGGAFLKMAEVSTTLWA